MAASATRRVVAAAACLAVALAALLALDRAFPPDLSRLAPSRTVLDRHGAPLRAFLTADGQWRFAAAPADVSPNYLRMLVAVEDKRFARHPGIDPLALGRAMVQLVARRHVVSGGSTLTMQVARLLEPRPRTVRAKLIEMARALQIERRMSKAEILSAYLALAPMGGNLEGVRAGSLAWFGKEPRLLSDPEAALLVALPRSPVAGRPDRHPARAFAARRRGLRIASRAGLVAADALAPDENATLPTRRLVFPRLAPHLAERLGGDGDVRTTLDAGMQARLERLLHDVVAALPAPVNAAVLVADWHSGEILARAGSADAADRERAGMNDMTRAVRSPGSTLKPFVYGLAFDGLLAHPASVVRDEPTRFDDYAPRDFDGTFGGEVTVRRALQQSLNLPAVLVLQRLGPVVFADRLARAGLPLHFDDPHAAPSLPLVLGGVGVTLEQLVAGYAALADGGSVKPLFARYPAPPPATATLMGRAAADAVVDILAGMPPPRGGAAGLAGIAYKTGTSFRFRDGWAIGFDAERVVGVWTGRPDGGSCASCLGAEAAALLFRVFRLMPPRPLPPRALAPVFSGTPPGALARLDANPLHAAEGPRIGYPIAGSRLLLGGEAAITVEASGGRRPYRWIVDGRVLPSSPFAREARWQPPGEGFSTVTVVDATGRSDAVRVRTIDGATGP